jgi:hypothetical protein
MHPNIPVSFRGRLARTPPPHGRAGIVRAFVEDLPNSNSDVDTTYRTVRKNQRKTLMHHPNSPRRRSLDANPTDADSDNLSAAALAKDCCDSAVGLAGL